MNGQRKGSVAMKAECFWTWDGRIIGTGDTPEQDHHIVTLPIVIPGRISLNLPITEMLDIVNDPRHEFAKELGTPHSSLMLLPVSRVSLEIDLKP